ncbi:MAG: SMC-Scp complex subunit ScpB, partial [Chlamydiota bacterium]|nr:SMC-Scp complex subunit ScpB [Chlamydiota bacterium]
MAEMDENQLRSILEALLMVSSDPVTINDLKTAFGDDESITNVVIRKQLETLIAEYDDTKRGFQIVEVAQKYQICTRSDWASWVKRYFQDKTEERLSQPALETLAIIAYRQPITKMEVESIRGVNVDGMIRSLI